MIIFGFKGYQVLLGVVTLVCSYCGNPAAQRIEKVTNKFTLFFIPLFPVSTRYTMHCAMCGAGSKLDAGEAERLASSPTGPGGALGGQAPATDLRKGQGGW